MASRAVFHASCSHLYECRNHHEQTSTYRQTMLSLCFTIQVCLLITPSGPVIRVLTCLLFVALNRTTNGAGSYRHTIEPSYNEY